MARNNKRINKYKTYFDLNRNAKEKKKSVTDYSQGLAMTKESIKNVFEYLHPADEIVINSDIMTISGKTHLKKNEVTKSYNYEKTITPIVQQLYDNNFFNIVSGKYESSEGRMLKTIEYDLNNNPIKLNQRGSANENLAGLTAKLNKIQQIKNAKENGAFFVYDTETIGGLDTNGIWRPMGITEFSMHQINGTGEATGLKRMDVVLGLREYDSSGKLITKAEDLPIIKRIKDAIENRNIADNEELRVTASRFSLYGDNRTKIVKNTDGSFKVGSFIDTSEGDMTDLERITKGAQRLINTAIKSNETMINGVPIDVYNFMNAMSVSQNTVKNGLGMFIDQNGSIFDMPVINSTANKYLQMYPQLGEMFEGQFKNGFSFAPDMNNHFDFLGLLQNFQEAFGSKELYGDLISEIKGGGLNKQENILNIFFDKLDLPAHVASSDVSALGSFITGDSEVLKRKTGYSNLIDYMQSKMSSRVVGENEGIELIPNKHLLKAKKFSTGNFQGKGLLNFAIDKNTNEVFTADNFMIRNNVAESKTFNVGAGFNENSFYTISSIKQVDANSDEYVKLINKAYPQNATSKMYAVTLDRAYTANDANSRVGSLSQVLLFNSETEMHAGLANYFNISAEILDNGEYKILNRDDFDIREFDIIKGKVVTKDVSKNYKRTDTEMVIDAINFQNQKVRTSRADGAFNRGNGYNKMRQALKIQDLSEEILGKPLKARELEEVMAMANNVSKGNMAITLEQAQQMKEGIINILTYGGKYDYYQSTIDNFSVYMDVVNQSSDYYKKLIGLVEESSAFKAANKSQKTAIKKKIFDKADSYAREYLANNLYDHDGRIKKSILGNEALRADMSYFKGLYEIDLSAMPGVVNSSYFDITQSSPENLLRIDLNKNKGQGFDLLKGIRTALHGDKDIKTKDKDELDIKDFRKFAAFILDDKELKKNLSENLQEELYDIAHNNVKYNPVSTADSFIKELRGIKSNKPLAGIISTDLQMKTLTSSSGFYKALNEGEFLNDLERIMPEYLDSLKIRQLDGSRNSAAEFVNDFMIQHYLPSSAPTEIAHRKVATEMKEYLTDIVHAIDISGAEMSVGKNDGSLLIRKSNGKTETLKLPKIKQYEGSDTWYIKMNNMNIKLENAVNFGISKSGNKVTMDNSTTFGQIVNSFSVSKRSSNAYEKALSGSAEKEAIESVISSIKINNKRIQQLPTINKFNGNDLNSNHIVDFSSIANILPELFGKNGNLNHLVKNQKFLDSKLLELLEEDLKRYTNPGVKFEKLSANMIKDITKNLYELFPILAENAGIEGMTDLEEILKSVSFTANEKQSSSLKGVIGDMPVFSPQSPLDNTQRPTILASGNAIPMRMKGALKLQEQGTGVIAGNMISTAMTDKKTLANLNGVGEITTDIMLDVAYLDTNSLEIIKNNHFNKVMNENNVETNSAKHIDKMFNKMSRLNTFEQERHMDSRIFEELHGIIPAEIENVSASKDFVNAIPQMQTIEARKQLDTIVGVRGDIVINNKGDLEYKSAVGKRVKKGETILHMKGYSDKLDTISPKMEEGIFVHRFLKENNMTLTDEEITEILNKNKSAFIGANDKLTKSKILEDILEKQYNVQGRYRIESTKAMNLVKPMSSSAEKGMTNLNYLQTGSIKENVNTFFKELGYASNIRGSVITDDAIKLYMHEAGDEKVKKALKIAGLKDVNQLLKEVKEERHMFNKFLFGDMLNSKAHLIVNDGVLKHGNSGQVQFGVLQKSIDNIIKKHSGDINKAYNEVVSIINSDEKYQFLKRKNLRNNSKPTATAFRVENGRIMMPDMGTSLDDLSLTEIDKLKNLVIKLDEVRDGHGESVVHKSGYIQKWNKETKQMELKEIIENNPVLGAWRKEIIGDKEVLVAPITKESMKLLPDVETQSGTEHRYFDLQAQILNLKKEMNKSNNKEHKANLLKKINAYEEELRNYENISKRMKIGNLEYRLLDRVAVTDDYLNLLNRNLSDESVKEAVLANKALKGKIVRGDDGTLEIIDKNLKGPALEHWVNRFKGLVSYNPNTELLLTKEDVKEGAEFEHLADVFNRAEKHNTKIGRDSAEKIHRAEMAELAIKYNTEGKLSINYLEKRGFEVKHIDDINFEVDEIANKHLIVDLGKDFDTQHRYIASPGLGYKLGPDDEIFTNGQKEIAGLAHMYDEWKHVRNIEGQKEDFKIRMQDKVVEAKKEIRNSLYGKNAYMDSLNAVYVDDVNYRLKASGAVTSEFTKGLNQSNMQIDNDLLSGSFINNKSLAEHHKEGSHYDYKFVSLETMRKKGMFETETMRGYGIDVDKLSKADAENEMIKLLKRNGTIDITGRYPNNMIDSLTPTHVFLDESLVGNQTKVAGVSGLKMLLDHDGDSVSSFSLNYITEQGHKIDYGMFVNNPERVKQISETAYKDFERLEGLTAFRAVTENHKWLDDVNDVIVKDVIRNSELSNLNSSAFVPGGNSILGNISPASISRIDRIVDIDANESIVREAVEKSNKLLENKEFASNVSLIKKKPEDLSNAEFFDNTLSVLKTATEKGVIDEDYLIKAENAVVSKLLTEKAATSTLAKTGVATTGGINVATNAIKNAAYDVMGKENPLAIDMLNTALYVPEQAAISYKKVKSVYNDTKGRDITQILSDMFPSRSVNRAINANLEDFNNWYQTHAEDKVLEIYNQFKGRLNQETIDSIGNNKEKQINYVMGQLNETLTELAGNELFQSKRLDYRSRYAANEVIAHSYGDDMGSITARLMGHYDNNFASRYDEYKSMRKKITQIESDAKPFYANTQTTKQVSNAISNMVDSLSSSSFKVGGGLAMGALGLAGGLMAAGYASGNPLNDKQASQVAQEQQPTQTMSVPDFMDKQGGFVTGNSQQGYIINIKADTKKGRKHMQRIMKQAAEASVGGAVSVNMNIRNSGEKGITDSDIENFLERHF